MRKVLALMLMLFCSILALPLTSANPIGPPEPYNFIENYLLIYLMAFIPVAVVAVFIAYFIKKRKKKPITKQNISIN
jgi:hypothetical protein